MMNLNGETIRALNAKLPAHVFDELLAEFPDFAEMEPHKVQFVHWETCDSEQELLDWYDYNTLEDMQEDYWVEPYTDGWLVIE